MVGFPIGPNIKTKPRAKLSLPNKGVQASLLTRSGPFITIGVAPNLLKVGAALMQEPMKRVSAATAGPGAVPAGPQTIESRAHADAPC
jgi:hypothetical protein